VENSTTSISMQTWVTKTVNHHSTYPDLFTDSHLFTDPAKTCERILHHRAIYLDQLCPTRSPRCGPVEGFEPPSLGFSCSESTLYSDKQSLFWWASFDIFDSSSFQCHIFPSVTIAVWIWMLWGD